MHQALLILTFYFFIKPNLLPIEKGSTTFVAGAPMPGEKIFRDNLFSLKKKKTLSDGQAQPLRKSKIQQNGHERSG